MFTKGHKINLGKRNAAKVNHGNKDYRLLFTLDFLEENKPKITKLLQDLLNLPEDTDIKIKLDVARVFMRYAFVPPATELSIVEQPKEKKYTPENIDSVMEVLSKEGYSAEDSANICLLFTKIQTKLNEIDSTKQQDE